MKHKTADRPTWERVLAKRFVVSRIDTPEYHGYVTLLHIDAVAEPLYATFGQQQICIADSGYDWLQHFPDGQHYTLLTAFDRSGELVQWYIDICKRLGIDERGIPWYDDLYLDIVLTPEGETLLLDVDELDEALRAGQVTQMEYNFAWRETTNLLTALEAEMFPLLWLSEAHHMQLLAEIAKGPA
jgi:predicted RNA-binding protein associated with RNAse of E/G family